MIKTKNIESSPIKSKKGMENGYYYCIRITTKYDDNEEETEYTDWYISPNGIFSGGTHTFSTSEPPEHIFFGGTFDRLKYKEYVEQMKEFKEDWEMELEYDDELYEDFTPKRNYNFDVTKFEEEYLLE